MADVRIDYAAMVQEALRAVVRSALEIAAGPDGLPGEHHFFLTFKTKTEGVVLAPHLIEEYPDEMTIVLRSHYWDLDLEEDAFSVGLSFHQQPERLRIPFAAISRFFDPVAGFALQFEASKGLAAAAEPLAETKSELEAEAEAGGEGEGEGGEVVSLDAFRKK